MTNVTFHSRGGFKKLVENEELTKETVAISVSDTEDERSDMAYFILGHCHFIGLVFRDDESSFQKHQAEMLVQLIDEAYQEGKRHFVVHCFAGVSRSGAIAKYINDFYGQGPDHPILGDYKVYNRRVYTMLENAYHKTKFGITHSWEM